MAQASSNSFGSSSRSLNDGSLTEAQALWEDGGRKKSDTALYLIHEEYEYPSKLPSHRYRYSQWHDLKCNDIRGDELWAPRIRLGPEAKEKLFYSLSDENDARIHHNLKGRQRRNYRNAMENWEQVVFANLSYQEMQHEYQQKELARVVSRLQNAQQVLLMEDNIRSLSGITIPNCLALNLARNYIENFQQLPYTPRAEYVNLADNNINDLCGLRTALPASVQVLDLRGNPVAFLPCYRQRVFRLLPSLRDLDGVLRLPEDDHAVPTELHRLDDQASCIIL